MTFQNFHIYFRYGARSIENMTVYRPNFKKLYLNEFSSVFDNFMIFVILSMRSSIIYHLITVIIIIVFLVVFLSKHFHLSPTRFPTLTSILIDSSE